MDEFLNSQSPKNHRDHRTLSSDMNRLSSTFAEFLVQDSDSIGDDERSLSTDVQKIARTIYQEFETILELYGSSVLEHLMPIVVGILEKLDELFKDQAAYRAEVVQLREDKAFFFAELEREKNAHKDSESRLMSIEDQFEEERKSLNEVCLQNEQLIRQLEMKNSNLLEQVARLEKKEADSTKENSKLHERVGELLRSNVELTDNLKNTISIPNSATQRQVSQRQSGNGFDTTSAGFGFDELSAMEGDLSQSDEEFAAGMQKEIEILIKENMELLETKNALNIVKDDLLNQRDTITGENRLLLDAIKQMTEKNRDFQNELASTDQLLNSTRAELDKLRVSYNKLKKQEETSRQGGRFTKTEMSRLIADRNYYKERLMDLQEAVQLTEALRASHRGHPELLSDLPSVSDVRAVDRGDHDSVPPSSSSSTLTRLLNLVSLPRLDFGLDALEDFDDSRSVEETRRSSNTWIKILQTVGTTPIFGWVRGFGRVGDPSNAINCIPAEIREASFNPRPYPVPKRCRSIGGAQCLRIELTASLSVPSPLENGITQHLWLIGRGPASNSPLSKVCGKVYLFDPLLLAEPLASLDLPDDFLPLCAGHFTPDCNHQLSSEEKDRLLLFRDFQCFSEEDSFVCQASTSPSKTLVLIASSDGRFLVCASCSKSIGSASSKSVDLIRLATFKLADGGESATALVSLNSRVFFGVLNSSGCNKLVSVHWRLDHEMTTSHLTDAELNDRLVSTTLTLPGTTGSPSGPVVMSEIYDTFLWLGTVGGGGVHCFNLSTDAFCTDLCLPTETPCLHSIAIGSPPTEARQPRLIWMAVSGSTSTAPSNLAENASSAKPANQPAVPFSRLLSICSKACTVLHCIELASILNSMIDSSDVVDPIDLTVCRLFVQGDECVWFATRCGLIGRFFLTDGVPVVKTDGCHQDSISLSCHGYRRPVIALIAIESTNNNDQEGTPVPSSRPLTTPFRTLVVVAVGHDYVYLRTSQLQAAPSKIGSSRSMQHVTSGAHAVVWSVSNS